MQTIPYRQIFAIPPIGNIPVNVFTAVLANLILKA